LRTHEETAVTGHVARNAVVMPSMGAGEGTGAAARFPGCAGSWWGSRHGAETPSQLVWAPFGSQEVTT